MGIENHSGKIKYDERGIARLDVPDSWKIGPGNSCRNLMEESLRKNLGFILQDNISYSVFQVSVNPYAQRELYKYTGKHKWNKKGNIGYFNYRKARKREEYRLQIDSQLKDEYFGVLNNLIKINSEDVFITFSAVDEDIGGGWHSKAFDLSPKNYIIKDKGDNVSSFKSCINSLNDDSLYEILKRKEHLQNYCLAHIDLLRKKKILPLILGEKSCEFDADTLRNAVNFLIPFRIDHESHDSFIDGDF